VLRRRVVGGESGKSTLACFPEEATEPPVHASKSTPAPPACLPFVWQHRVYCSASRAPPASPPRWARSSTHVLLDQPSFLVGLTGAECYKSSLSGGFFHSFRKSFKGLGHVTAQLRPKQLLHSG
jgi:hypothetical protein